MLDTIYNVLDQDPDATGGVMREIANLFEDDKDKQASVLEALNAFRVQLAEQFPALGGGPTGLGTNWAGVSSGPRHTHTGRGNINSRVVWNRVEAAAASHPANRPTTGPNGRHVPGAAPPPAFPALEANAAGPSRGGTHSTPWASGGAGSSNNAPTALVPQIRSVNYPVAAPSKPKAVNAAAFPFLPSLSSAKSKAAERAALFTKPTARDESIARIRGTAPKPPVNNTWSATNGVEGMSLENNEAVPEEPRPAGSKKKGKQKQLLFSTARNANSVIGVLGLDRPDHPTLHVGEHHLLHGKMSNLPRPYAVIRRAQAPSTSINILTPGRTVEGDAADEESDEEREKAEAERATPLKKAKTKDDDEEEEEDGPLFPPSELFSTLKGKAAALAGSSWPFTPFAPTPRDYSSDLSSPANGMDAWGFPRKDEEEDEYDEAADEAERRRAERRKRRRAEQPERTRHYEVVGVVRKKVVFALRPEPLVAAPQLPE